MKLNPGFLFRWLLHVMLRGRPRRAGAAGGGTSSWSRRSSPSSAGAALATPMPGPSTSGKEAIIHPVSETINTHTMFYKDHTLCQQKTVGMFAIGQMVYNNDHHL
ncbi:hypothetical protein ACQJBY_073549 [Aegilops geniculata]